MNNTVIARAESVVMAADATGPAAPADPVLSDCDHLLRATVDHARYTAGIAHAAGRSDLADLIENSLDRPCGDLPTVVVVGETKRGKSSLVNALLRRPRLSPVAVDIATCVHLTFRFAEVEYARVRLWGDPDPVEIDLDELPDWAGEDGNPGNQKGVAAIEVGLDIELLRHLTLVDTPGVGGLELGHAELTLQALGAADAILFVLDAGSPISATEMSFLRRASERIDTVAFALTKIDLYPGWRRIRSDNQQLLRSQAPRFAGAPVMPTSSLNAERALALTGPGLAGHEWHRAGLDALQAVLTGFVADRARQLHAGNTLRVCLGAIADLRHHARNRLAGACADPARMLEIDAEQTRLATLVPPEANWRRSFEGNVGKVALWRDGELKRRLDELQVTYLELGRECRSDNELRRLSGQFGAAVDATLTELARKTAEQLLATVTDLIDVLADSPEVRDSLVALSDGSHRSAAEFRAQRQKKMTGLELFTAVTPALSIDRLVTVVPSALGLGLVATGPIGIGIGVAALAISGGAAMLLARERKRITTQNSFVAWIRDYAMTVRDAEQRAFATALIDTRRHLSGAVEEGLRRRAADLMDDRARLDAARSATAAQRDRAAHQAAVVMASIDQLNERVGALLAALQLSRGGTSLPGSMPAQISPPLPSSPGDRTR